MCLFQSVAGGELRQSKGSPLPAIWPQKLATVLLEEGPDTGLGQSSTMPVLPQAAGAERPAGQAAYPSRVHVRAISKSGFWWGRSG